MQLTPIWDLLKSSFSFYFKKENLIYFTKMAIAGVLFPLLAALPMILVVGLSVGFSAFRESFNPQLLLGAGGIAFIFGVILVVVAIWTQVATVLAIIQARKGEITSVKATYKAAWSKLGKFFVAELIVGIIIGLGFILLIIPGIIFAVWFSFTNFQIVEGKGILESIKGSKALVSGLFFPVLIRFLVIFAVYIFLQILAGSLRYGGAIIMALVAPYFVVLPYLLYEDVKRLKG